MARNRLASSTASSRDLTFTIANPATSSFASANGPSRIVSFPPVSRTRAPLSLGSNPSVASSTPDLRSSPMSFAISGRFCLHGGTPGSGSLSGLNSIMYRIAAPRSVSRDRGPGPGAALGVRLDRRQPGFEVLADHLVHVHHHREALGDEVVLAVHRPLHRRPAGRGREGDRGGVRPP